MSASSLCSMASSVFSAIARPFRLSSGSALRTLPGSMGETDEGPSEGNSKSEWMIQDEGEKKKAHDDSTTGNKNVTQSSSLLGNGTYLHHLSESNLLDHTEFTTTQPKILEACRICDLEADLSMFEDGDRWCEVLGKLRPNREKILQEDLIKRVGRWWDDVSHDTQELGKYRKNSNESSISGEAPPEEDEHGTFETLELYPDRWEPTLDNRYKGGNTYRSVSVFSAGLYCVC